VNVIIDTGCANISSLKFAVERITKDVIVSEKPEVIQAATRVFLPGVGSAGYAMDELEKRGLVPVIQSLTQPVLGICLGMQLLMAHSSEGDRECLGLIPGQVSELKAEGLRLPHMGWNTLVDTQDHPLFMDIPDNEYFYFVHSFAVEPGAYTLSGCDYGSLFSAAVGSNNFYGVQFHPERSGPMGARILKNFLEMSS